MPKVHVIFRERQIYNGKIIQPGESLAINKSLAESLVKRNFAKLVETVKPDEQENETPLTDEEKIAFQASVDYEDKKKQIVESYMDLTLDELKTTAIHSEINTTGFSVKKDYAEALAEWELEAGAE